jgi:hypothetical protein
MNNSYVHKPEQMMNQTPGLYPKENTLHQQHGESLKTKMMKSMPSK